MKLSLLEDSVSNIIVTMVISNKSYWKSSFLWTFQISAQVKIETTTICNDQQSCLEQFDILHRDCQNHSTPNFVGLWSIEQGDDSNNFLNNSM